MVCGSVAPAAFDPLVPRCWTALVLLNILKIFNLLQDLKNKVLIMFSCSKKQAWWFHAEITNGRFMK